MEYKYITPENMQSGQFTAYSGEMYDEAERYNYRMSSGKIKKRHFYELYIGFIAVNVIYIGLALFLASARMRSPFTFGLYTLYSIAYIIAFVFMNIRKRNFNIIFNSVSVAGLVFANIGFWFAIAFNAFMTNIISKKYAELISLEGYPIFLRLIIDSKEIEETEKGKAEPVRKVFTAPPTERPELEELDIEAELRRKNAENSPLQNCTAPKPILEEIELPPFIDLTKKK